MNARRQRTRAHKFVKTFLVDSSACAAKDTDVLETSALVCTSYFASTLKFIQS